MLRRLRREDEFLGGGYGGGSGPGNDGADERRVDSYAALMEEHEAKTQAIHDQEATEMAEAAQHTI